MKRVWVNKDNVIIKILEENIDVTSVRIEIVPDDCEIGCQYIDGQWIPRPKNDLEKKIEALGKAVLTGDKSDLEAL
jgi:hypothetical protein